MNQGSHYNDTRGYGYMSNGGGGYPSSGYGNNGSGYANGEGYGYAPNMYPPGSSGASEYGYPRSRYGGPPSMGARGGGYGSYNRRYTSMSGPKLRPGDWVCECYAHNFASRDNCYKCGKAKADIDPSKAAAAGPPAKPVRTGDWYCVCGAHNFSGRQSCYKCNREKAEGKVREVGEDGIEGDAKNGDYEVKDEAVPEDVHIPIEREEE